MTSVQDQLENLVQAISQHVLNSDTIKNVCKMAKFSKRTTDMIGSNTNDLLRELKRGRRFCVECINGECIGDIRILREVIAGIEHNNDLMMQWGNLENLLVSTDARPITTMYQYVHRPLVRVPIQVVSIITHDIDNWGEREEFLSYLGKGIRNDPTLTQEQVLELTRIQDIDRRLERGLDMFATQAAKRNCFECENDLVRHISDVLRNFMQMPALSRNIEHWMRSNNNL